MIITHTQTTDGKTRVYLGGKASLECWIEPREGQRWSFRFDEAVSANTIAPQQQREYAAHLLMQLAIKLSVAPADLADIPFENIAALHDANPFESRRVAMPRKKQMEHGYMATEPRVLRPSSDFQSSDFTATNNHLNRNSK